MPHEQYFYSLEAIRQLSVEREELLQNINDGLEQVSRQQDMLNTYLEELGIGLDELSRLKGKHIFTGISMVAVTSTQLVEALRDVHLVQQDQQQPLQSIQQAVRSITLGWSLKNKNL